MKNLNTNLHKYWLLNANVRLLKLKIKIYLTIKRNWWRRLRFWCSRNSWWSASHKCCRSQWTCKQLRRWRPNSSQDTSTKISSARLLKRIWCWRHPIRVWKWSVSTLSLCADPSQRQGLTWTVLRSKRRLVSTIERRDPITITQPSTRHIRATSWTQVRHVTCWKKSSRWKRNTATS